VRILALYEMQLWKAAFEENAFLGELIIVVEVEHELRSSLHRLEQQQVLGDVLADEVEREQRVAEVVKHPHEDHEVELFAERAHVIDVELSELDLSVVAEHLGREPRLREVAFVAVDAEHARGSAPPHLDRIESCVAADVEHALAAEIARETGFEAAELRAGIIAQEMVGRGPYAIQIDVVEPRPERLYALFQVVCCNGP